MIERDAQRGDGLGYPERWWWMPTGDGEMMERDTQRGDGERCPEMMERVAQR